MLQVPANAAVDVLRAQSAAYTVAFAVQGPFLLAVLGAAWTLRRPGIRAYALVYTLLSVASVGSALSVGLRTSGGSEIWHDAWLAIAMLCFGAVWEANEHGVRALAGTATTTWPRWRAMLAVGVLCAVVVQVLSSLQWPGALGEIARGSAPRPVILFVSLLASVSAWRASRSSTQNAIALRLIAAAFLAFVVRQAYGIFASIIAATGGKTDPTIIAYLQTATTVFNGVGILAAMGLEERTATAAQAELIRATEVRLARAQRMESLGQMAGGIAHDFANVLMIIDGEVAGARESRDPAIVREHLEHAATAVDRASDLTKQLAMFARQRPPAVVEFAVGERLRSLEPLLRRLVAPGVTLSLDTTALGATRVAMDPSQFDQVLLNLVINARDSMTTGGTVTVTASAEGRADVGGAATAGLSEPAVTLRVTDSGSGISPDVIDRIFEPFYSTKGDRGTGLGLATVSAVVRAARGDVTVSSTMGVGSTFVIRLPALA